MVLQDGEPGGGLQLFVVEGVQVGLGLLDFVLHLLPQLLDGLDLVTLLLVYPDLALHLFGFNLGPETLQILFCSLLPLDVVCLVREITVQLGLVDIQVLKFLSVFTDQVRQFVLVLDLVLFDFIFNSFLFAGQILNLLLQTCNLFLVLLNAFFVRFGLGLVLVVFRNQVREQVFVLFFEFFQTNL